MLSVGWRRSLEALLKQERDGSTTTGNAGLNARRAAAARRGFRPLRVSHKVRESGDVTSLLLEPVDGTPSRRPCRSEFIVLRLDRIRTDAGYLLFGWTRCRHDRVSA